MTAPLSDELALRIALAAKELKYVDAKTLLGLLIQIIGEPITVAKITRLRAKKLKSEGAGLFDSVSSEQFEKAFALLKGRGVRHYLNPKPEYELGTFCEISGSLRVACASDRGELVDGLFSDCQRYLIYQVSPDYIRLIDIREPSKTLTSKAFKNSEKNRARATLIEDCSLLYTRSIGALAAAQVVKLGLHPIKLEQNYQSAEVLKRLQTVLSKANPPPWLAKAIGKPNLGVKLYGERVS